MLALVFVIGAFFLLTIRQDLFGLGLSVVFAGLAFGTKYTGIFAFPFLCIPYINTILRSKHPTTVKIRKCLLIGVLMLLVFLLTWFLTNPSVILYPQEFFQDISYESDHIARGHRKTEPTNPFLWFPAIYDQLSFVGSSSVIIGLLLGIFSFLRKAKSHHMFEFITLKAPTKRTLVVLTIFLYTLASFFYLMIRVNLREPHYMFHVIPYILVLSSLGFAWLYRRIPWKLQSVVSCLLCGLVISISINTMALQRDFSKKPEDETMIAGHWLEKTYPPAVKILYEIYSYIPPTFKNVKLSWYITEEAVQEFDPDLIVLTQKASGRISWKKMGTKFADRDFMYDETVDDAKNVINFHTYLFSENTHPWQIVYETDRIVILEKQ
jgi:hypothetical protein